MVWSEELVPPKWREGLIVNFFIKGDPGSITLLSVVGRVFCKIVNDRHLESGGVLHEGQAAKRNLCIE